MILIFFFGYFLHQGDQKIIISATVTKAFSNFSIFLGEKMAQSCHVMWKLFCHI
jgi:hypothetical protein